MCRFVGFVTFIAAGFGGGYVLGIPKRVLFSFAIIDVVFLVLLLTITFIARRTENPIWKIASTSINFCCVLGFGQDSQHR
jgi:hypothetical protein